MINDNERKQGNGLIAPEKVIEPKKEPKKIPINQDGLMERDENNKVVTEDGRELLKEN